MDKNMMIGIDLAKNIFQLHIATMAGAVYRKRSCLGIDLKNL